MSKVMPLDSVVVGDRYRKDLGDVDALAVSIQESGLLHPVVVTPDNGLVAGQRRLEACRRLGWTEISVTVVDNLTTAASVLRAERDENTCRKEMVFSELLPLKHALEELERPKSEERHRERSGRPSKTSPKLGEDMERHARETKRVVAKALGKSATTMDKVEEVHRVADAAETPEPVRSVAKRAIEHMDSTGKADPGYRAVKDAEAAVVINGVLDGDDDLARAKVRLQWAKTLQQVSAAMAKFETDTLVDALDEECWSDFESFAKFTEHWLKKVLALRPKGLRVVGGRK